MVKTAFANVLIGLVPLGLYVLHQNFGFDLDLVKGVENSFVVPTFLGFALVGFLGWRLNQSRILMVSLLLIGAYYAALNTGLLAPPTGIGTIRLRHILCSAFPVTLILIFLTRETRFLSKQSVRRVILALSPIALMAAWFKFWPAGFEQAVSWSPLPLGQWFRIPQLSIVAVVIFLLVFFRNKDRKIHPFMGATAISLIPFFTMAHIGLAHGTKDGMMAYTIIAFSSICIILLSSIFMMYWQRVYKDELTDIPNRRALDESLTTLDGVYCIAMIDIDHFKKFNDRYGHDQGDNVLRFVALIIEGIRGAKVYRYGGEEFCAVFRNTSAKDAFDAADNVRLKLANRKFHIRSKKIASKGRKKTSKSPKTAKVTISVGIASPDRANPTPNNVLKLADTALYKAKKSGRNKVVLAG
jgi:diguanylate cyclase (GGDEF)-like protein